MRISRTRVSVSGAVAVIVTAVIVNPSVAEPGNTITTSQIQQYVNEHGTTLGGMYLEPSTNTVVVNLPLKGAEAEQRELRAMVSARSGVQAPSSSANWQLDFRRVTYSTDELEQVMSKVGSDEAWHASTKETLVSWAIDPRANRVRVELTAITPQVRQFAAQEFGDAVVLAIGARLRTMEKVTTVDGPIKMVPVKLNRRTGPAEPDVAPTGRLLDLQPYFGGDRIFRIEQHGNQTSLIQCTVAFMWSNPAMSTAGHCGPAGVTWMQGYYDTTDRTLYYTGTMGTNFSVQWGDGRIDGALMNNGGWLPYIYNQPQSGLAVVGGTFTISVGQMVCFSGSFTNENCTGRVDAVNACLMVGDEDGSTRNVCGLDTATSTNQSSMLQQGDSGGPVYQYFNNQALAAGIISAGDELGIRGAFTDYGRFRDVFGGSVRTP